MNTKELILHIQKGGLDQKFSELYGNDAVNAQRLRYIELIDGFEKTYGEDLHRDIALYSVAGRSELAGNHTDHNCGKVIAASIDLDIIAAVSKSDNRIIRFKSRGFDECAVDLEDYTEPREEMFTTSNALIAGVCRGFLDKDYRIGGFNAYSTSNVLKGSGLSSSAAFEDMIGNILSHEFNDGKVGNVDIAKISKYSENMFFGKPCGLMDQMACAVGGIISIDFKNVDDPVIEKLDFDINGEGFNLCIVDTGGNHADLGEDYASIPFEMKSVAEYFGKRTLSEVKSAEVIEKIPELRKTVGDRAVLRALHFFGENERVDLLKDALKSGELDRYFEFVKKSGASSFCYLQNVYTVKNLKEQGLSLALCLAEKFLSDKRAAWRVHGGGFAGTVQAYVPSKNVGEFKSIMDHAFGKEACIVLKIRKYGAVKVY